MWIPRLLPPSSTLPSSCETAYSHQRAAPLLLFTFEPPFVFLLFPPTFPVFVQPTIRHRYAPQLPLPFPSPLHHELTLSLSPPPSLSFSSHLVFNLFRDVAPSPAPRLGEALSLLFLPLTTRRSLRWLDITGRISSSSSSGARALPFPLLLASFPLLVARGSARHLSASRRRLLDSGGPRRPPGLPVLRSQRPGYV